MSADNDPMAGIKELTKAIGINPDDGSIAVSADQGVTVIKDGKPDRVANEIIEGKAPIERRHISLIMWLQNIKRIDYGARLLEVVNRGGILTIPSGTKEIDTYSRHVVSLKGELGPCSMFYDGSTLIKMTIALHGFAIIGGLQPPQAHKITGTHLRGYQLDVLEIRLGMTWGEVGE